MACKGSQVRLLVEFGHHLFLIRILIVHLLVLNICRVDSIKLFLLVEHLLRPGVSIVGTIQVLLILLLIIEVGRLQGLVFVW